MDFRIEVIYISISLTTLSTGLRTSHGICPSEVFRFLLDLFKYNDNSRNHYSDNYYRAALVDALGQSITPVISVVQQGAPITAENLSTDAKYSIPTPSFYKIISLTQMLFIVDWF